MIHKILAGTISLSLFVFGDLAQLRAIDVENTRLLSQGAVSEKHVAFVYDGDLWIAKRDGSDAHRLTSHEGAEISPRFSPDGKSIAFSAQYDGNTDVFIMPVGGGLPKRSSPCARPRAEYPPGIHW